jgi:hypothetical protein
MKRKLLELLGAVPEQALNNAIDANHALLKRVENLRHELDAEKLVTDRFIFADSMDKSLDVEMKTNYVDRLDVTWKWGIERLSIPIPRNGLTGDDREKLKQRVKTAMLTRLVNAISGIGISISTGAHNHSDGEGQDVKQSADTSSGKGRVGKNISKHTLPSDRMATAVPVSRKTASNASRVRGRKAAASKQVHRARGGKASSSKRSVKG